MYKILELMRYGWKGKPLTKTESRSANLPNAGKVQAELRATAGSGYKTAGLLGLLLFGALAAFGYPAVKADLASSGSNVGGVVFAMLVFIIAYCEIKERLAGKVEYLEEEPAPTAQAEKPDPKKRSGNLVDLSKVKTIRVMEQSLHLLNYHDLSEQKKYHSAIGDTQAVGRIRNWQKMWENNPYFQSNKQEVKRLTKEGLKSFYPTSPLGDRKDPETAYPELRVG